jgi:hypothetical protein
VVATYIHTHTFGLKEKASLSETVLATYIHTHFWPEKGASLSEMVVATYIRNYMVSKPKREKLSNYGYF